MNTAPVRDPSARIAALEAALNQARADAQLEREQFERRLKLAQTALPERRDPRTVAMNIAAQQDVDALRGALRERDRVVKELTEQVRGLEDRLEDHYRKSDDVKRDLKQREQELDDAQRKLTLAMRRVETLRAEAPAAAPAAPAPEVRQPAPAPRHPQSDARSRSGAGRFVPGLMLGLLIGLIVASAAAGALWWTGQLPAPPSSTAQGVALAR